MARAPDTLATARLRLVRWSVADAEELRAALDASDAHLRPWIPFMKDEPRSLAATREWLWQHSAFFDADEHWRYAVRTRSDNALVGEVMLLTRGAPGTLEAGYWLHAAHTGRAYTREAVAALLPLAFETLKAERVAFVCDERNHPSIAVARALGAVLHEVRDVTEREVAVRLATYVLPQAAWRLSRLRG
jgi:RimJ/RimL family protein N-acetyltransferase